MASSPEPVFPSPNVAEDHQTKNAQALSGRGAAVLIPDSSAVQTLVHETLKLITDIKRREILSGNIITMADRDADVRIAEEVLKLAGK